jgi:excinuclease UvrABC helicase subunit UvrB
MSQSQGKQLADIINTLIRITPRDTYEMVASQIDTSVDDVTKQIQDSVEFDHPYITDLSKAFSEQLTPLLHAMLISAS